MPAGQLTLAQLSELAQSSLTADRAFADALIRLQWGSAPPAQRGALAKLHGQLALRAAESHRELMAAVMSGALRGAALRAELERVPLLERDHHVEELLGIAYPPLEERAPDQDMMSYVASGYAQITHAFDTTGLSPDQRVLDLGSGLGKVALLAELLYGAQAFGVERDAALHALALDAGRRLSSSCVWACGDARSVALPEASVIFAYLPFSGAVLRQVLERLWSRAGGRAAAAWLCAGPLSSGDYPAFEAVGEPCSWLQVYRTSAQL
jgi:SAM-dependent methyltransferase